MTVDVDRMLVFTLSNIGDLVLTTPLLEALHARYPACAIDLLGDARSIDLLAASPWLGDVFRFDKRAGLLDHLALIRRLRSRRYALFVDLRTHYYGYFLRAACRVAKPRHRAPGRHAVEYHFAALASLFGDVAPPNRCTLHLDPSARRTADGLLHSLPGTRWLAIAPGANWPGKKWPVTRYAELLRGAASTFDAAILLGGADDAHEAAALVAATLPVVNLAGQTPLLVAAAVLARASAFVGNDSGLGHMAAAVGTPTVTVFGPGEPARYRPWGPHARVVMAPHQDLAALPAEPVLAELRDLLASPAVT